MRDEGRTTNDERRRTNEERRRTNDERFRHSSFVIGHSSFVIGHSSFVIGHSSFVLLLAFALRVFRLDAQSLWYDEAFSVYLAHFDLATIAARTAADIQPPLYYALLHFWIALAGDSEFALRFLSLVFGVLTVPLAYVTARRLFDVMSARLVALLVALAPLYVWYAQEARMYTLITFLLLLASYALWRALSEPARATRWWIVFTLANLAATYTHYFAFVVIAFQVLWVLVSGFRFSSFKLKNPKPLNLKLETLKPATLALVAIIVAFLPWMPFVIARFGQDASYWRGALKLDEALRHILINFTMGESVLEHIAQPIALGWLIVLSIGLVALSINRQSAIGNRQSAVVFCVLYLLVPLALLLVLFSRNPKFNARYLMIASPAFYLLLAAGMSRFTFHVSRFTSHASRFTHHASRITPYAIRHTPYAIRYTLTLVPLAFLLITAAYADYNIYFDPAFTKASFRDVVRYIEQHIAPDEAIILTSGHLFPAFHYYYRGDAPTLRLPDEPTLNTERVLGYETARVLNETIAGKRGAWVVLWQDEVVDPNGFLLMMLEEKGQLLEAEDLWHVRLRHFALPEGVHFSSQPEIQHPIEVNFEGRIKLLGYDAPRSTLYAPHLTLYWQAQQPLTDDYQVSLRLRDEEGHYWGRLDRRPAAYLYPTTRWKVGELLFGRYELPVLPGTPPGEYQLEVILYSAARPEGLDIVDGNGVAKGVRAIIGTVTVPKAERPPSREELGISQPLEADFGRIALLGYELGQAPVQPGDRLYLMLFWQTLADVGEDYSLTVTLVDKDGKAVGEEEFSPLVRAYPTSRWLAGEVWRGQYDFTVPVEAQPGRAWLQIGLTDASGRPLGKSVSLASLEVQATARVFTAPETRYPSGANLGDLVTLIGADLDRTTIKPGETLHLTLYWQTWARIEKSYTVFTHLLDADSHIWAQQDGIPVSGARPTTGWVPGEVVRDEYRLIVDPQAPPGNYVIEVGLYDASDPTMPRLAVLDRSGQPVDNRVLLAEVRVE